MKLTLDFTEKEAFFLPQKNVNEDLIQAEMLDYAGLIKRYNKSIFRGYDRSPYILKSQLSWDFMLHNNVNSAMDMELLKSLESYGLQFEGLENVEKKYQDIKKRHDKLTLTLDEFKNTIQYQNALDSITDLHGANLFPYQIECAAYIVSRKRLLNAMDMGLGKTRTTIAGLTANPNNTKILIVTMSRNIHDWINELKVLGYEDDFIELRNPSDMKSKKRIHIVSYERWSKESVKLEDEYVNQEEVECACGRLLEVSNHFCSCGFTVLKWRKKPLYKFFNRSYKAAAIDEGHLIKNGDTARNRAIMAIKTPTRVLLSGTPAESGAADLFWPLTWLLGDSYHYWNSHTETRFEATKFGERCFKVSYGGLNKVTLMDSDRISSRASNVKELWALQDKIMFRKKKTDDDVINVIEVPKPVHRRIHIEQTKDEKDFYQKTLKEFSDWFAEMKRERAEAKAQGLTAKNKSIEINVWLEKLRRAASSPWIMPGFKQSLEEPSSKLKYVKEHLKEEAANKRKMLIFTAHKQTCEELGGLLDGLVPNYSVGYIHGSVPMDKRKELMARFQDENDDLSILIMTMRTGAESYTLTEAKSVILWDLDYNAKKIQQCYSRAVRLGQKDVVSIIWLINVDTIDANMHSLVLSKSSSVDLAVDRESLDFQKVAKEFEGQGIAGSGLMDFETFAEEMLKRGNNRSDYELA